MMRRYSIAAAAGLALGAPALALAADPLSYSYWQAAYLNSEVETAAGPTTTEDDSEGFRAALNISFARYVFFTGDTDQRRYTGSRDAFSSAGLGVHTAHPVYQFYGAATYERTDHDESDPTADDAREGYGVEAGVRINIPHVALHAAYRYLDFGKEDGSAEDSQKVTGALYGAGAALQLSPWWALVADYRVREHDFEDPAGDVDVEYSEWTVGFRRYFATDTDRRKRRGGVLFPDEPAQAVAPETPSE